MWIVPFFVLSQLEKHSEIIDTGVTNGGSIHNIIDLYKAINDDIIYSISIENNIIYEPNLNVQIDIENFDDNNKYELIILLNDEIKIQEEILNKSNNVNIDIEKEGENSIKIIIKMSDTEKVNIDKKVYYIEKYKPQFLEELTLTGVSTHFGHNTYVDDINKSLDMLTALGTRYIRDDIRWELIDKYGYSSTDKWIIPIHNSGIKILGILGFPGSKLLGTDWKVSNEEELQNYNSYLKGVISRYNYIESYEIWNEPNSSWITEQNIYWYSRIAENTEKIFEENNIDSDILVGSTMTPEKDTSTHLSSQTFFSKVFNNGAYKFTKNISYHQYDSSYTRKYMKSMQNKHTKLLNDFGGFINTNITENGVKNKISNYSETERAQEIIKQTISTSTISKISIYYGWRDIKENPNDNSNYGLINYDYTPKPAYYAMKNYYENTNGAEYIGTIKNLENIKNENLEAHVYDKDGKPKIIVWSNNSTVNIVIPYKNFKATDLYGEEIQPDENGNLVITTSPVYLDEVDYNYFYQAISNMATEKYNEFTEKFAGEIAQVPELTSKIEENKKYMESVGQVENKIVGSATIQAMKNHFELGNLILQAYRDGKLQAEDVKVSSMLDMLNDIGDSYEDLVTVSAQTVEQAEIEQTNKVIQEAETTINNNQGCEIIYPVKILDFAKDYYEKATYINSLEEENDIKNGLIISNKLHASLLANWAKEFAQINIDKFVDEYIANNPVTIEYSNTELTNQNVKATITTNAEIQITNNSNSKEHTFEQNGSFTFEYTIKGRALNITATVQNIDKVAPSISGVQKAKLYTKPVTPKINDENLKEIKLILNSHVVSNYKNGDTLEEEGFYELTATDKAGNTTTTYFQIFINNDTDYKIEENYIKNVTNNTKKSDFDKKLNLSVDYKIYRNETELKTDDIIATGDVLTTEAGDSYTIIVPGDINKDGQVNLKDFIKMRIYLLLENNLDDIEMLAADCNNDNQPIGVKDYIRMRLIILTSEL